MAKKTNFDILRLIKKIVSYNTTTLLPIKKTKYMKNFVKLNYYYSSVIFHEFFLKTKKQNTTQYTPQFATMTKEEETNNDFFLSDTSKKQKLNKK